MWTVCTNVSPSVEYGKSSIGSIYTSSSPMIASGGSRLSKSESSSTMVTSSTCGLPDSDGEEDGVSIAGMVDKASLSDSTLILVPASSPPCIIVEGEGGEEDIDSRDRLVRRLMVTLLEVGSGGGSEGMCGGVWGASALSLPSNADVESIVRSRSLAVSTDLLRDPPLAILCRFLEVFSSSSVNGFVRAEQGSERSRSAGS